jgi:uncharacterized protein DUF4928
MVKSREKKRLIAERLASFSKENKFRGKGPLSVAVVLTRKTSKMHPPFSSEDFLTAEKGQVSGLGGPVLKAILLEHKITRILADEAGRTSRGSINKMRSYIPFLNELHSQNLLDFKIVEAWWIDRVREYFAGLPLTIKADASMSLRHIVSALLEAARARQKECPGTMVVGAVMQHLVGAKLSVALPQVPLEHNGFSVADAPGNRKGDFLVHDAAIHVTTSPSESLIQKCCKNLKQNLRPVIVTKGKGVDTAEVLAQNADIADRIDILEVEQFIATNVYEWSLFAHDARMTSLVDLVNAYNKIVDDCESDPSLKISLG